MDFWSFDNRRKFVVGLWLRVISAAVFLIYLSAAHAGGLLGPFPGAGVTFASLACLLLVNGVYWYVGALTSFDIRQFYVHWVVDIGLIFGVLLGLGSLAESVLMSSFTLIIVTSATFISRRASMVVAAMASAAVAGWIAVLSYAGDGVIGSQWDEGKAFFVWASGSIFFVLIAFLAGTLAKSLSDANKLLEGMNRELADRNRELAQLQDELEFHANVIAHDIRGPVSAAVIAIQFTCDGASSDASTPDPDPLLGMALENLRRVDGMIDRLNEVRQLKQSGLQMERIDWQVVVKGLRVELGTELDRKRVSLDVQGELPEVVADQHYMTVLLRNALGNAMRYVPEDGTGRIVISGGRRDGFAEFAVSDNGPGLAEADSEELFRMFRKGSGDERAGAMGLGLTLARRVVERHGGEIWFGGSELGGATLRFKLPAPPDVRVTDVAAGQAARGGS